MHAAPNDWAELERELVALAASGAVEVREDGEWLAELTGLHCEVHHQGKNPLIHLWSDERNLTRRLLRVKERNPDRILLEVQRFGKAKPGQLEFLLRDNSRPAGSIYACHPNPAQLRFVFTASNLRAELMRGLFLAWENRSKD